MKKLSRLLVLLLIFALCVSSLTLVSCDKKDQDSPLPAEEGTPQENPPAEEEPAATPSVFVKGEKDISIGVLADIHVMASTQAVDMSCEDFKSWEAHGQKMLGLSESILKTAVDRIIAESDFDVVLVSGDNADDGGYETHQLVASELKRLEDAGIKVFTIPGNHDINSKSYTYASGKAELTRSVTETDFVNIYSAFGYDSEDIVEYFNTKSNVASFAEGDNLSYVADLNDQYRLIAIDMSNHASTYTMTDEKGVVHPLVENRHDGAMTEALLLWAVDQIDQAKKAGLIPIGMMHFPLLQHFGSLVQAENGAVNDPEGYSVAEALADAGMQFIFTGHIHIQDNALYTSAAGSKILDINSASLCNYPMPVRCFRAKGDEVEIRTWQMNVVDEKYLPSYLGDAEKSAIKKDFVSYSIGYLDDSMLAKIKNKVDKELIYKMLKKLGVQTDASDSRTAAFVDDLYDNLFLKFLKLPLYEKDAAGGLSVESTAKLFGKTIPASDYTDVFNLAMSFVASMYGGDESLSAEDDRLCLLEYSIYAALYMIDDFDFFGKIKELNPDFAEIDLTGSFADLYEYGTLELVENNLFFGILTSLDIRALEKFVNVDESKPYESLNALVNTAKTLLSDYLVGLDLDDYLFVSTVQKEAFLCLGDIIKDLLPSSLALGLTNDSLAEGSTYRYKGGETDSAPADNDMKINMQTMAYVALK